MPNYCVECELESFKLSCAHIHHVLDMGRIIHYGRCSYCCEPLSNKDKLFMLEKMRQMNCFYDGKRLEACPDNQINYPAYDPYAFSTDGSDNLSEGASSDDGSAMELAAGQELASDPAIEAILSLDTELFDEDESTIEISYHAE